METFPKRSVHEAGVARAPSPASLGIPDGRPSSPVQATIPRITDLLKHSGVYFVVFSGTFAPAGGPNFRPDFRNPAAEARLTGHGKNGFCGQEMKGPIRRVLQCQSKDVL